MTATTWVLPSFGCSDEGEVVHGNEVSSNYFAVLGVPLAMGRAFTEADYRDLGGSATVLNFDFWANRDHFGNFVR